MPHQKPYSSDNFIQSFREGEETGFDFFFRAYYKRLCYFAGRYINDIDIAGDIVSDAFIKVWHKRQKFTHEAFLRNYLYIAVRNGCLRWMDNQIRHSKHRQQASFEIETTEPGIIDNIVHAEFIHQVYQALEYLPPACRTIFNKLYIEGKSVKETALELQLSRSTIKTQKDRGIGILRKRLLSSST